MRVTKIWIVAALGTICAAQAADPPQQKPGLWEIVTSHNGNPSRTLKVCIDEKTADFYLRTASRLQKDCTKSQTQVSGSTITRDAVCKLGSAQQVTTHGVTTFHGDDSYEAQSQSHWDPPLRGKSDTTTTVTGKWLSETCATGMKPGDVMMPDGRIISANIEAQAQ
jgi:Protein of unknown function (DUF3617)